jgi:hypothetical protein
MWPEREARLVWGLKLYEVLLGYTTLCWTLSIVLVARYTSTQLHALDLLACIQAFYSGKLIDFPSDASYIFLSEVHTTCFGIIN